MRCTKCGGYNGDIGIDVCKHCRMVDAHGYSIDYQIAIIEKEIRRRRKVRVDFPSRFYARDYIEALNAVLNTLQQVKQQDKIL